MKNNEKAQIRHLLIFNLKSEIIDSDKRSFFEGMENLKSISGITNFQISEQINPKTKYKHVLTMDFDSEESLQAYLNHPQNRDFVHNFWLKMIEDYLVIDSEVKI
ncbi:MAG: Dabb family protein [Bacteroidota bacterium]